MKKENNVKTFEIPKGCFCQDQYCGDCIFLDLDKPGYYDSDKYYCPKKDDYRKPTDTPFWECSDFRRKP